MSEQYLIGQRVILNGITIGTVCKPEHNNSTNCIWVDSPEKGYPSCYAEHNIKPLPNGQL